METTSRPRGAYRASFPVADLRPGDFVLVDRIAGYVRVEALTGPHAEREIVGRSEDGLVHSFAPTGPRVSAWVAHRDPAAEAANQRDADQLTAYDRWLSRQL
jgi:hypothetical protein